MLFKDFACIAKFFISIRIFFCKYIEFNRSSDSRNNILALGIKEVFTVKVVFTRIRVACKADSCPRIISFVSEYHLHNIYSRTADSYNVLNPSVSNGLIGHPRTEYGSYRTPKLFYRILREGSFYFFFIKFFRSIDNFL